MPRRRLEDAKQRALKTRGTLHARAQDVTDPLFEEADFFDPRDLLQIKYEMLRRVRVEGLSVAEAARRFGLSRPAFYKAKQAFERDGLWGLLPLKRGPRRAHKFSETVMAFLVKKRAEDPSQSLRDLMRLLEAEFALRVHPRSLERALKRAEKKTP